MPIIISVFDAYRCLQMLLILAEGSNQNLSSPFLANLRCLIFYSYCTRISFSYFHVFMNIFFLLWRLKVWIFCSQQRRYVFFQWLFASKVTWWKLLFVLVCHTFWQAILLYDKFKLKRSLYRSLSPKEVNEIFFSVDF